MGKNVVRSTIEAYDLHAEAYSEYRPLVPPVIKRLDLFAQMLREQGGNKVLDIGCGPGRDAEYLCQKDLDVVGVDLSRKLIKMAKVRVKGVDFRTMDMRALKFTDGEFDGLWVNTSFLHIPRAEAATTLQGFNRVLKAGGIMFLSIQGHRNELGEVKAEISKDQLLIMTRDFGESPRFFAIYNEEEITALLKAAGFEVFDVYIREEQDTKIQWINIFARKI